MTEKIHPDQAQPYYCTIPLEEYEEIMRKYNQATACEQARILPYYEMQGWRSFKNDPPPKNGDDFIFCGHQKYDFETEDQMEYFVDVGYLDMDGTLHMNNDWHEGQQTHEIDYWMPLPPHPDEPRKEQVPEEK